MKIYPIKDEELVMPSTQIKYMKRRTFPPQEPKR